MKQIPISFFFLIFTVGCTNHNKSIESKIRNMVGSHVEFPKGFEQDTTEFIIASYVDSLGCVPCRIRIDDWHEFINNICNLQHKSFKVVFIAHPESHRDVVKLLKAYGISNVRVLKDVDGTWKKLYMQFDKDDRLNTWLINSKHELIICGSPFINDGMEQLYMKYLLY